MTIAFGGVDLPSIKPEAIFAIHLFLRAWWCVKVSRAEKANFLIYYRITLLPQSKNVIFRWNMELLHTQKSIWSSVNRIVSCIFFKCLWLVWASSSAASRGSHRFNRLVIFSHGKKQICTQRIFMRADSAECMAVRQHCSSFLRNGQMKRNSYLTSEVEATILIVSQIHIIWN